MRWDLVLDDRYFMASNELNLLNTLLLEDEGRAGSEAHAIRRVDTSGVTIAGGFHVLNHWR